MGATTLKPAVVSAPKLQIDDYAHYDFDDVSELPYNHLTHLGNGNKAVVDKVRNTRTNRIYARKIWQLLPRSSDEQETEKEAYRKEIQIARRLSSHLHIVRIVESYSTKESLALILEPAADEGDLKTFLARFATVRDPAIKAAMESTIIKAYGCLASGLAHMHSLRIRHRDIKPENILIHAGAVFYTDFGVSRDYSDRAHSATEGTPDAWTLKYCAPEVRFHEKRTWRSDVFSLGCVYLLMYAALSSEPALLGIAKGRFYEQVDEIQDALMLYKRAPEVVQCMRGMMRQEESERLRAAEVVQALGRRGQRYFCAQCDNRALEEPLSPSLSVSLLAGTTMYGDEDIGFASLSTSISFDAGSLVQVAKQRHGVVSLPTPMLECDTETMFQQSQSPSANLRYDSRPDYTAQNLTTIKSFDCEPDQTPFSFKEWVIPTSSFLTRYGIHRHKIVHSLRNAVTLVKDASTDVQLQQGQIIYEDDIYDWMIRPFGLGIRLTRRKPYGSVFQSISTYPIVESLNHELDVISNGSVEKLQYLFSTQILHPHIQDQDGQNLFDLAFSLHRFDVCALLLARGVHPTFSHENDSLLLQIAYSAHFLSPSSAINLLSFVLKAPLQEADWQSDEWQDVQKRLLWNQDIVRWLFENGASCGLDAGAVNELCLRITLRRLTVLLRDMGEEAARKEVGRYLTTQMQERIRGNDITLLDDLFELVYDIDCLDDDFEDPETLPWTLGSFWLTTLSRLEVDIDIPTYLTHELTAHPGHILDNRQFIKVPSLTIFSDEDSHFDSSDRRIVASFVEEGEVSDEGREEGEWSLGWHYVDEWLMGEMVVGEFEMLVWGKVGEWPFGERKTKREYVMPGAWMD